MENKNENWIKTGIALVDEQHREYFRRLNLLLDKVEKGELHDIDFMRCLDYFRSYAVVHFDTEELLMKISSFPGPEEHVQMHGYFRGNVDRMADEIAATRDVLKVAGELKFFLFGWLEEHINSYDLRLAGYLKGKVSEADRKAGPS